MELPRDVRLARMLGRIEDGSDMLTAVCAELDPIGSYSTSYPFLALARRIDARYGDVLWFADYLTTFSPTPRDDPRFSAALERLSHEQRSQIAARVSEMQRAAR